MGGEGYMMDMIQKMKLNRQQRIDARTRFSKDRKPPLTYDFPENIEAYEIEKPKKLSKKEKRKYQIIAIVGIIVLVILLTILLFLLINS